MTELRLYGRNVACPPSAEVLRVRPTWCKAVVASADTDEIAEHVLAPPTETITVRRLTFDEWMSRNSPPRQT